MATVNAVVYEHHKKADGTYNVKIFHQKKRAHIDTAHYVSKRQLLPGSKLIDLTFYWARHTFAALAGNKRRIPKDEVAMALNHVDNAHHGYLY